MKIARNTSRWSTPFLRTLVCRVHDEMARTEGKLKQWAHLKVTVFNRSGSSTSGHAYVGGTRMHLSIGAVKTSRAAWLVWHELQHIYGYGHDRLSNASPEQLARICDGLPEALPESVKAPKPKRDRVAIRYKNMSELLTAWERKAKLAKTKLTYYRAQVRTYERRYAASGRLTSNLKEKVK